MSATRVPVFDEFGRPIGSRLVIGEPSRARVSGAMGSAASNGYIGGVLVIGERTVTEKRAAKAGPPPPRTAEQRERYRQGYLRSLARRNAA